MDSIPPVTLRPRRERPSAAADRVLAERAARALDGDPLLPKGCVRVVVQRGWIVLVGEVRRGLHRWAAEADVRRLPDAVGVENRIVVRP